jgi:catechol 2,3-dioxygenase-like lactoylglutathione lyase family enzyme
LHNVVISGSLSGMSSRSLSPASANVLLSHVVLRTAHVPECIDFYSTVLGMKVVAGGGHGAVLSHDNEHHRIAIMGVPDAPASRGPGLEHHAWKVRGLSDLLGNYKYALERGVEPFIAIHHGGTMSVYYRDPDGMQVEVFIDTMALDAAIEMLNSPAFAQNPIGVPLDMEELCRRYEAGESMASLLEQPPLKEGDFQMMISKFFGEDAGAPA